MDNKKIRELLGKAIDNAYGNWVKYIYQVLALLDEPEKIIPCTCCLCDKWECHTHDFCPKIGIYGKPESQPCKTCGGSKKVQWDYNDPEVEAIVKAEGDCPDCQKQDEFVKRTRELFEGFRDISETGKLLLEACDRLEAERKEKRLWKKRTDEAAECVSDYEEIKQKLEAAEKENEKLTESKSFFKKAVIERMKTIRQQAERIAYLEAGLKRISEEPCLAYDGCDNLKCVCPRGMASETLKGGE